MNEAPLLQHPGREERDSVRRLDACPGAHVSSGELVLRGMTRTTYFLSSLDSRVFEPVRTVAVRDHLVFDTGKPVLLVDIDPPVVGQGFGFGHDISTVVLASRVEGREIDAIEKLPFFVHIALSRHGWADLESPLRADDLITMAWGELYGSAEAARSHSFD